jgi:putative membrane protein
MHDGFIFGMGWLWLLGLFILIAAIWVVARAVAENRNGGRLSTDDLSPEDVLRNRFARGDIDEDEFRSRLDALSDHGNSAEIDR